MRKIKVNPGVCGLESIITVNADSSGDTNIEVETKCPAVKKFIESLEQPVDGYTVVMREKPGTGEIYEAAANLSHAACPVPSALIKAIEVECKLALPKTVEFTFIEE